MPTFKYRVRNKFGKLASGTIGADSKEEAAKRLEALGYTPVSLSEQKESYFSKLSDKYSSVKREDLNLFTRQLVTLIKAGIPILASLKSIEMQTKSKQLKKVAEELIRDVESGNSFSEALTRHPRAFDELYTNTIHAGEVSGSMDEVMERLADLGEHEQDTVSKIKVATRYPLLAMIVLFVGFIIMTAFILPQFAQLFSQMNTALPLPTVIMLKLSHIVRSYWYMVVIILSVLIFLFLKYIDTKKGKYAWHKFILHIPIFGPLINLLTMSRFSRITAIMIKSGIPILEVMDIVSKTVGNAVITQALLAVKDGVREGKTIAEPMRISGVFPPIVIQMISVGEETGKLDELLLRVSDYYDKQADYMIKNLSTLIEPVFIMILASGVLVLALSVFLPIWNMYTALSAG